MFTVGQRDALRDRVLAMAREDRRVVAGAAVGSFALGEGDRYSDLDLTFGIADGVSVREVLDDWTRRFEEAVHLIDLERGATVYRVFLFPDLLQFDLSMTPAREFRPAGPRFQLLFGETVAGALPAASPPATADLFGWGVIYALHARSCIERGRLWQAEHYVGAVRDHALTMACLREGQVAVQARGYDNLAAETLAWLDATHVGALEAGTLRAALAAAVTALLHEGVEAHLELIDTVAEGLAAAVGGSYIQRSRPR